MTLLSLSIRDFRCFEEASIHPDPQGLTVLRGVNGSGKTSVLEAIGWLATNRSIRGASRETLVRDGAEKAILRAETSVVQRRALIEAEIPMDSRARVQVNRQVVRKRAELCAALQVSVFSPSDRRLVEGGPAERREYLDEVLAERHPRLEAAVAEVEHVLRQRSALLRQCAGRLDHSALATLEVWDDRLASSGTMLVEERESLARELEPMVSEAYGQLARSGERVGLRYQRSWAGELGSALLDVRDQDLRRQVTTLGPHRDELEVMLGAVSARTHGSQGEQRCIALALRLATHELRRRYSPEPPVLLLDDVFSELDRHRSEALVACLPLGQVLLTTASDPPAVVGAHQVVEVAGRVLLAQSSP
ncbi:MAG TPA: DNA replication and repair protein RecF [Acidimicrobiales bacterium]|nr:DNA replication and repair protein RecF [Acidimicrobiales bacterium]